MILVEINSLIKFCTIMGSVILLVENHGFFFSFLLHIFENGKSFFFVLLLHFFSKLFVLHLFVLYSLKPVVIMPNGDMIVRFEVHGLGLPDPDGPLHEVSLVIVVDGRSCIFNFVELDKAKASLFFCDVIDGYLNGLDLSECVKESEELLFGDSFGQVTHIDGPLEVILVYHLL